MYNRKNNKKDLNYTCWSLKIRFGSLWRAYFESPCFPMTWKDSRKLRLFYINKKELSYWLKRFSLMKEADFSDIDMSSFTISIQLHRASKNRHKNSRKSN